MIRLTLTVLALTLTIPAVAAAKHAPRPPAMKYDEAFVTADAYAANQAIHFQNHSTSTGTKIVDGNVDDCIRISRRAFDCPATYDTTIYYDSGNVGTYSCTETIHVRFRHPRSILIAAYPGDDFKCGDDRLGNG